MYGSAKPFTTVFPLMPPSRASGGVVGERAYSWIPPGVFPEDTEYMKKNALAYDPKQAKAYFDELKKEGILKDDFEFPIYTSQNPYRVKIATAVATELRKYGLKARVESLNGVHCFPF